MANGIRVAHITTVDLTARHLLINQLTHLRDEGYEVTSISAAGPWVGALERAGIRHIEWPHATRAWDPVADVRAFFSLKRILDRERFQLVHTHNPKPGFLGRIAARLTRTPCVINTVHGLYATPEDPLRRRLPILMAEWLAAKAGHLELYQSEEDLDWARRLGIVTARKSALLGNGVDLSVFDPDSIDEETVQRSRRELKIAEGVPVVVMVGRLVAEKGYHEFAAAARLTKERYGDVVFLAVGGGDPVKRDTINETDLTADVMVTGWREDVRELLALADVFVLPSWREGVPRSAIEAAAMGRPIVLTDIRGCREVIRHEREGLLVPPKDPQALNKAIMTLLGDPDLAARLGRAARARTRERFDEARVIDTISGHYRRLLIQKGLCPVALGPVMIRKARRADVSRLAELHMIGLPDAFLPRLGEAFMRTLYRALITDKEAELLVAELEGRAVGFVSAVESTQRFYRRFVARYGLRAAATALPRLVSGRLIREMLETVRYPSVERTGLPGSEILAVAVDPTTRGRGIGGGLLSATLDALADRGVTEIKVALASDNVAARNLYGRKGFRKEQVIEIHRGVRSEILVKRCLSSSR